jgi:hypothetical protein
VAGRAFGPAFFFELTRSVHRPAAATGLVNPMLKRVLPDLVAGQVSLDARTRSWERGRSFLGPCPRPLLNAVAPGARPRPTCRPCGPRRSGPRWPRRRPSRFPWPCGLGVARLQTCSRVGRQGPCRPWRSLEPLRPRFPRREPACLPRLLAPVPLVLPRRTRLERAAGWARLPHAEGSLNGYSPLPDHDGKAAGI